MSRQFVKTHGVHGYQGARNSRAKRFMSKLYKGLNCGNLLKAFTEVEKLNEEVKK